MSEPAFDTLIARYGPEMGDFLTALGRTPRDWFLQDGRIGRMCANGACQCPLVFIYEDRVGDMLGWPERGSPGRAIAHAADDHGAHDPELRHALLLMCGFRVGE